MKKFLLLLAASFTLNGLSQTSISVKDMSTGLNVAANSTITLVPIPFDVVSRNFDVKNIGSATNTYKLIRYDIMLHKLTPYVTSTDSAHAYYCFGGQCFGASTRISGPQTLTVSQSSSQLSGGYQILTADLAETSDENVAGKSIVKYTVFNTANANDTLQFTLLYLPNNVGVNSYNKLVNSIEVFPNPTKGDAVLNFVSDKSFESKVSLINSLGQVVSQNNISVTEGKNKIALNTQNLNSGIYFVSLKAGEKSIAKKLIIN
ncbi:MAG: T9SS type A sorting domain-containing protein [Bacteroidia bacterium]|nr:T9SS type A sorting domain-containing protein [Bacteroidia bacterium]